jgi:hypothetical protein
MSLLPEPKLNELSTESDEDSTISPNIVGFVDDRKSEPSARLSLNMVINPDAASDEYDRIIDG